MCIRDRQMYFLPPLSCMRTATATCAASTEPGPSTGNSFSTTLSFGSLPISAVMSPSALMGKDPKLKVVLKEFPVLGPGSVEAAQVAVAVRMQDKTGKKYLDFHQKLLSGRGQADKARALAAAKDAGLDMARIEKD